MILSRTILFFLLSFSMAASAQVLNIGSGATVNASGNVSLVLKDDGIKNDGTFIPGNSSVYFDGGSYLSISGSEPVNFYNIIFKGSGLKTNGGTGNVINTVSAENTTFDADGLSNDKSFTLLSSDTATARVDVLTTGDITGNVTVERYIHTGVSAGQHGKSWQFLATPTTGQAVFQSWQENGLTPAGYGTWLSGTGTGFDVTSGFPSMKYYDPVSDSWTGISNTGASLQNKSGYMLFVRGDRTVTTYNASPNQTNMRSKGVLFTPSNPPSPVPVTGNLFQSFGNPYASRIEFNKVYQLSTGINNVYYAWDPMLAGSFNVGGYQTISAVAGYMPTAGNATSFYPAGVPAPYIESGQAVFVKGNGSGGNVNFDEQCIAGGSRLVNRLQDSVDMSVPMSRQLLFTTLISSNGKVADGNIVAFENGLGNSLNEFDAQKILNEGENFGLIRNNVKLAVEARDNIIDEDTIFYSMKNLRQQNYTLMLAPLNFNQAVIGFFIDKFSESVTPVSFTDTSYIYFSVTADQASSADDRFLLVFKLSQVLPVKIIAINAHRSSESSNIVSWKVENELNVDRYELQQSSDGGNFVTIGSTNALQNNGITVAYNMIDQHAFKIITYYRIKVVEQANAIQYSRIVSVRNAVDEHISIYPNPVKDRTVYVKIHTDVPGSYDVRIVNVSGQSVYETTLKNSAFSTHDLKLPELAAGIYQIIFTQGTQDYVHQLIVE